jgi:hypothetical protein
MSTNNALPGERLKAFLPLPEEWQILRPKSILKTAGKSIKSAAICGTPIFSPFARITKPHCLP